MKFSFPTLRCSSSTWKQDLSHCYLLSERTDVFARALHIVPRGNRKRCNDTVCCCCSLFFFLSNKQTKQIDGDSAHTFSLSLYLSLPLYLGLLCSAKIVYWTFSEFLNKSVQKQSCFCFILFWVCFLFCLVLHFVVGLFAFCFIMHCFFFVFFVCLIKHCFFVSFLSAVFFLYSVLKTLQIIE